MHSWLYLLNSIGPFDWIEKTATVLSMEMLTAETENIDKLILGFKASQMVVPCSNSRNTNQDLAAISSGTPFLEAPGHLDVPLRQRWTGPSRSSGVMTNPLSGQCKGPR